MAGIRSSPEGDSDQPVQRVLKPSEEVESKMRPVSADFFHNLLRRAATTQTAPKPAPPLQQEAAEIRSAITDLKEKLRDLKRSDGAQAEIDAIELQIAEKQKTTRELESRAAEIDAATFDLKAVNPRAVIKRDERTAEQIVQSIEHQAKIVSAALTRLRALLTESVAGEANSGHGLYVGHVSETAEEDEVCKTF